ncbi:hypothetical protein MSPP1_001234 [Malassezia sp. CBS 17886]|nr:hypothetical protein MSPP1_001234 [Malassezia sp. CBS 17886]
MAVNVGASPRALHTSRVCLSRDMSWVDQGPVTYNELKPYAVAPSGDITIIDVREPNEVAQGMIPSAVNVPLSVFPTAFDVNSSAPPSIDFQREFSFPRPSYDSKIIFYCRSGKRSAEATDLARKRGWWDTRNYPGGWLNWVDEQKKEK